MKEQEAREYYIMRSFIDYNPHQLLLMIISRRMTWAGHGTGEKCIQDYVWKK
jgi:hypothetical protein